MKANVVPEVWIKAEWDYVYQERLGMLCEDREPTAEERLMAHQDADRAVLLMQGLLPRAKREPVQFDLFSEKAVDSQGSVVIS